MEAWPTWDIFPASPWNYGLVLDGAKQEFEAGTWPADDQPWKAEAAENAGGCGVEKDAFNRTTFDPVATSGLRLEVELQPGLSGGILKWAVE